MSWGTLPFFSLKEVGLLHCLGEEEPRAGETQTLGLPRSQSPASLGSGIWVSVHLSASPLFSPLLCWPLCAAGTKTNKTQSLPSVGHGI